MKKLNEIYRWIMDGWDRLKRRCSEVITKAAASWRGHSDRMRNDPEYADSIRDLIEIVVAAFKPRYLARFIADQILTAYMALLRLFGPPSLNEPGRPVWA